MRRDLAAAGVRRVNVSLDTLDPARFTAHHPLGQDRARAGGHRGRRRRPGCTSRSTRWRCAAMNEDEIGDMLAWCGEQGHDLCLIETMPMGDIGGDRTDQYLPLSIVRARLRQRFTLTETGFKHRRPGALLRRGRDRHAGRLHHADDPQFLRELQPRAADLHRHAVHVPRPGRRGRSARRAARAARSDERAGRSRSARRSRASRRATISSSTAATTRRRSRRHMSLTGG